MNMRNEVETLVRNMLALSIILLWVALCGRDRGTGSDKPQEI
jgi:hypothetical protein